jgi:hypothetical protein
MHRSVKTNPVVAILLPHRTLRHRDRHGHAPVGLRQPLAGVEKQLQWVVDVLQRVVKQNEVVRASGARELTNAHSNEFAQLHWSRQIRVHTFQMLEAPSSEFRKHPSATRSDIEHPSVETQPRTREPEQPLGSGDQSSCQPPDRGSWEHK